MPPNSLLPRDTFWCTRPGRRARRRCVRAAVVAIVVCSNGSAHAGDMHRAGNKIEHARALGARSEFEPLMAEGHPPGSRTPPPHSPAGGGATEPGESLCPDQQSIGRTANALSTHVKPQGIAAGKFRCVCRRPSNHSNGCCKALML